VIGNLPIIYDSYKLFFVPCAEYIKKCNVCIYDCMYTAGCNVGVGTSAKSNSTVNASFSRSTDSGGSSNRRQKSPQRLHPLLINQQNDTHNSTGHSQLSTTAQQAVDVKMELVLCYAFHLFIIIFVDIS